jgi:serine protease Do
MTSRLSKALRGFGALAAFAAGVVFASGMHWTALAGARSHKAAMTSLTAVPAEIPADFSAIAAHVTPAVVSVTAEHDARPAARQRGGTQDVPPGFEQFFGFQEPQGGGQGAPQGMQRFFQQMPAPQQQDQTAGGSGFIVSPDGYILTNNHVIEGADRVTVGLPDRRSFKARIVGRDPQTDIAVLKIDATNLPTVALGDDSKARVGEWVLAVGNPLQLDFTVTAGIISAKDRSNELRDLNTDKYAIQDFIQTDAAINPGNSGGPLVNTRGEVIGVNSAIASPTGYFSGYGFAIPMSLAKPVMDELIAHGHVRRAILGAMIAEVTQQDAAVAKLKNIAGVKIEDFSPANDSPAKRAGLKPGDIIVAADGTPVDRVSTLELIIRKHQPGDVMSLDAVRYGEHLSFKVRLAEAPEDVAAVASSDAARDNGTTDANGEMTTSKLGITVGPLSTDEARAANIRGSLHGVLVEHVERGGAAEDQLASGDVITAVIFPTPKKEIVNVADFQHSIALLKQGDYVGLMVSRQSDSQGDRSSMVVNLKIGG